MHEEKTNNDLPEHQKIFYDVVVVYIDDIEEHFEAVQFTDKGIILGRIIEMKFIPFGFIPKNSYKKIYNK
jgi:hypothetical protein